LPHASKPASGRSFHLQENYLAGKNHFLIWVLFSTEVPMLMPVENRFTFFGALLSAQLFSAIGSSGASSLGYVV